MDELQINRLPKNFYVYEMSDYRSLDCKKEAQELLDAINTSKRENDIQTYIKSNEKWFIPLSILKAYDFGHHFSCVVPEYQLGAEYRLDYLLIGKNSLGYQFVFVEFEDVNVDYRLKTSNAETDKVRKGLNQIRDWKRWIEQNRGYFLNSEGIKDISNNVPPWGFRYCLVVSRRDRMDELSNQLRGEMQDIGVKIISYDRIVDYVGLLHNGI
jgi:hypothetical protein